MGNAVAHLTRTDDPDRSDFHARSPAPDARGFRTGVAAAQARRKIVPNLMFSAL
jgi:hypothetical protein